jgi:hypothetical protein
MENEPSAVEKLVLQQLAMQDGLQAIDRGFHWQRRDDQTRLRFQPTTAKNESLGLYATAVIETVFSERVPAVDEAALARLNRRAVHGNFFCENGRIGLRASCCIYKKEPAVRWIARLLLQAMGEQLALGLGIFQSEFWEETLPFNRANLKFPRQWIVAPNPRHFRDGAERFSALGLVSSSDHNGLTLEVPLEDGPLSRLADPAAVTALLQLKLDVPHPLAGVGCLTTIALPYVPPAATIPEWCRYLNAEEHKMQDFVPRLGAWGMRGIENDLVYSMFWPTSLGDDIRVVSTMNWMVQRTLWIRKRYWLAGSGLKK